MARRRRDGSRREGVNDQGNPDDLGTHLGEIHKNDPTGRGADILVVRGTWVYDSAHQGRAIR